MKKLIRTFVIEDDNYFRKKLHQIFSEYGEVSLASDYPTAIAQLDQGPYDLVVIDMELKGHICGIEILKKAKNFGYYCIILTDHTKGHFVEEAYLAGLNHYLTKDNFEIVIPNIIKKVSSGNDSVIEKYFAQEFITQDEDIKNILAIFKNQLDTQQSVFIGGETGTGKGLLANFIHKYFNFDNGPFVAVNVAAIPNELAESEFFGHAKGAFTGAMQNKKGKLEQANGGTLFLDEIATMSLDLQAKLLKALDEKEFCPIGSNIPIKTSFRIISATCQDLSEMVSCGKFRIDLFHRLNCIQIDLPPLRQRKQDVPLLIEHFLSKNPRKIFIDDEARQALHDYPWPGNIRELKNTVEKLINCTSGHVGLYQLDQNLLKKNQFK